ncbi:MAG: hypothetical protein ACLQVY_29760 [Limisphaerales bacterium]
MRNSTRHRRDVNNRCNAEEYHNGCLVLQSAFKQEHAAHGSRENRKVDERPPG